MAGAIPAPPAPPVSTVAFNGAQRAVAYAKLANGEEPAREFYESLPTEAQVRFDVLFRNICDHGTIKNDEKFHPNIGEIVCSTGGKISRFTVSEFKVHSGHGHRILAVLEGRTYVLAHGCPKPKKKQLSAEISRAERFYCEDRRRRMTVSFAKGS
jgi:hypothetical protein